MNKNRKKILVAIFCSIVMAGQLTATCASCSTGCVTDDSTKTENGFSFDGMTTMSDGPWFEVDCPDEGTQWRKDRYLTGPGQVTWQFTRTCKHGSDNCCTSLSISTCYEYTAETRTVYWDTVDVTSCDGGGGVA